MRSVLRTALALGAIAAVVSGCVAEIEPEDQAILDQEQAEEAAAGEAAPEETDPGEEPIAESSQAICSCATALNCSKGQLDVYEHSDCCGGQFFFCPGDYRDLSKYTNNLGWFANWNDRISRVKTYKVKVYLYQHVDFKGDVRIIGPGQFKDLGGSLWNDQVSSIKVRLAL